MTEEAPKDDLTELAEHYERISDDDLLAEWERGEPVAIEVREPMGSRHCGVAVSRIGTVSG